MPVGILKFNLPEEQTEHQRALDGGKWWGVVLDLDEQLRSWGKHGHQFKTADEAIENARTRLHDLLNENNLSLDG